MKPYGIEHEHDERRDRRDRREGSVQNSALNVVSALRRCRQPVPARVVAEDDRPVRVTTDRRGYAGGAVVQAAGPWRTSGDWWADRTSKANESPWNRDEWEVALSDGGVYRIFRDRETDAWFIDGIFD
jgi:protein ImuB